MPPFFPYYALPERHRAAGKDTTVLEWWLWFDMLTPDQRALINYGIVKEQLLQTVQSIHDEDPSIWARAKQQTT